MCRSPVCQQAPSVEMVCDLLHRYHRSSGGAGFVALTGAGCSTASGIPDYRSPTGLYRRAGFQPLTWQRFHNSEWERRRYWCRSVLGYSYMGSAAPNAAHAALHKATITGWARTIVTQNVDGLHHLAANGGDVPLKSDTMTTAYLSSPAPLIELHGNIHRVACMQCKQTMPRRVLQERLVKRNGKLLEAVGDGSAASLEARKAMPDGDYAADDAIVGLMELDQCDDCGGEWRPDVVLFGENVPADIVQESFDAVSAANALVCLGTSLHVYSAYRFVEHAQRRGKPIIIVNNGVTRGDPLATLKVEHDDVSMFLHQVVSHLTQTPS